MRRHHGPIWARHGTIEARKAGQDSATLLFRQGGNEITLTIEVEAHTGDLLIGGSKTGVEHPTSLASTASSGAVRTLTSRISNSSSPSMADKSSMLPPQSPPEDSTTPDSGKHNSQSFKGSREVFSFVGQMRPSNSKGWIAKKIARASHSAFQTHNQAPFDDHSPPPSPSLWRLNAYTPAIGASLLESTATGWNPPSTRGDCQICPCG